MTAVFIKLHSKYVATSEDVLSDAHEEINPGL